MDTTHTALIIAGKASWTLNADQQETNDERATWTRATWTKASWTRASWS